MDTRKLIPALKELAWSDSATREEIQGYGVNVIPANFYSNIPSVQEIRGSFEYADGSSAPYLDEGLFDRETLLAVLDELQPYALEFTPAVEGDERRCERFFWKNSQFSYSDAMAYYCFIRSYRPRTIVEIGAGFSTLVALEATRRNGSGRIVCVEPHPREFLVRNPEIDLVRREAQSLTPADLDQWLTQDGDVLFIDSTHTVKTGSDCLHIYLRLLPKVRRRLLVHAHDVFLPFGLPQEWLLEKQIFWTEQYLLYALLIDNPRARVLYGSAWHYAFNREALSRMMQGRFGCGGSSFWFQYDSGH